MILIKILNHKKWEPVSKTKKLDLLMSKLTEEEQAIIYERFAQYLLLFLQALITNAIYKQKFPRRYKRLSPEYVKHKRKNKLKRGYWRATEFLVKSITYWKDTEGAWNIGFPEDLIHKASGKSKTSVALIARTNELGSKKRNIPARPLFIPFASAMSKNIYPHFQTFIKAKFPQYSKYI